MNNCSDNLTYQIKYVDNCILSVLEKQLPITERDLLEGILKTKENTFKYQEVVDAQYPNLDKERADKIATNYRVYFGHLKQTFQKYYDESPSLQGFEIKVTKDNFKRLLDTYIFHSGASELLEIRINNIFCLVKVLDQLQVEPKNIENLELFITKIKKIIQVCECFLNQLEQ